jgi:hypothetical protein
MMAKKTTKTTAKKTTAKKVVKKPIKKAVKAPIVPETVNEPAVETAAVEAPKNALKELLMVYNSVMPSRRRWIRNRNELRNKWKELFIALEQASGRTGVKADLFDYSWQKLADKGGVQGLVNKEYDEITIVSDSSATIDTSDKDARIVELESEVERLVTELRIARDGVPPKPEVNQEVIEDDKSE